MSSPCLNLPQFRTYSHEIVLTTTSKASNIKIPNTCGKHGGVIFWFIMHICKQKQCMNKTFIYVFLVISKFKK
uniref:Uncharacterized protein n=1 Tax=Oryza brachyantha TaxID=4533 RepID=J3L666_ORYBR